MGGSDLDEELELIRSDSHTIHKTRNLFSNIFSKKVTKFQLKDYEKTILLNSQVKWAKNIKDIFNNIIMHVQKKYITKYIDIFCINFLKYKLIRIENITTHDELLGIFYIYDYKYKIIYPDIDIDIIENVNISDDIIELRTIIEEVDNLEINNIDKLFKIIKLSLNIKFDYRI